MRELLNQIVTSWCILPGMVLSMFAVAGLYTFWYRSRSPKGYALVDAEQYKKEGEELIALRKLNYEFEREIAALKDKPAGPRVKPVIDWVTLNAVDTNWNQAGNEYEIGFLANGAYDEISYNGLSEEQVRELNEDFKAAIKQKHQPARFA